MIDAKRVMRCVEKRRNKDAISIKCTICLDASNRDNEAYECVSVRVCL